MADKKRAKKESKGKNSKSNFEEDIENKSSKKSLKKKQNLQIMWAVILMAGIILIIILVPIIKKNFFDKFEYISLDFQKTGLGNIIFYSTRIPVADQNNNVVNTYAMNFRTDPRKLDYISIKMPNNNVVFKKDGVNYISLDPKIEVCENNSIALMNLASFLRDFGNLSISSAVTDKDYASQKGLKYRDCGNKGNSTVIIIKSGDIDEIKRIDINCYELTFKDCKVIPVTEKFMLIILEKYMSFFTKGDVSLPKKFLNWFS